MEIHYVNLNVIRFHPFPSCLPKNFLLEGELKKAFIGGGGGGEYSIIIFITNFHLNFFRYNYSF